MQHDADDQGEQRAQAERESGQAGARPAKVADVDLQASEAQQERQPDRRHQPYRLVRFDQVQYRGAKHDPGHDLQHRPGDTPGRSSPRTTAVAAARCEATWIPWHDAVLVGHSMGTGEVTRYLGTRGSARVAEGCWSHR
jgi:pimeloyl-ACP methyl ester carboxylesterase